MTVNEHSEEKLDLPRLWRGNLPGHGPVPGAEQGVGEHLHPIWKLSTVSFIRPITLVIGAVLEAGAGALRT